MASDARLINLDDIVVDPAIQPRVGGLDLDHVRALAEVPDAWPPLVVADSPSGLVLLDGFHRYAAARQLGLVTVRVEVRSLPEVDLRQVAFELNARHGRALSRRDRRSHAAHLISLDPMVSNMAIADRAGLSPTTVQRLREQLEADEAIPGTAYSPEVGARQLIGERRPGELPEPGLRADLTDVVASFLAPPVRKQQRRAARYLERLAVAVDERTEMLQDLSPAEIAQACVGTLGEIKAERLATVIGPAAADLGKIAAELEYRPSQGK